MPLAMPQRKTFECVRLQMWREEQDFDAKRKRLEEELDTTKREVCVCVCASDSAADAALLIIHVLLYIRVLIPLCTFVCAHIALVFAGDSAADTRTTVHTCPDATVYMCARAHARRRQRCTEAHTVVSYY